MRPCEIGKKALIYTGFVQPLCEKYPDFYNKF